MGSFLWGADSVQMLQACQKNCSCHAGRTKTCYSETSKTVNIKHFFYFSDFWWSSIGFGVGVRCFGWMIGCWVSGSAGGGYSGELGKEFQTRVFGYVGRTNIGNMSTVSFII